METIIFDFGNVVGFFDHQRTLAKIEPHTDLSRQEMYRVVYDGPLEDIFEKGQLEIPDALSQIKDLWRARCDEDFLAAAIGDIFEPNAEVCELIPRLARRYRLLLGSNTNPIHARHFRGQFAGVLGHFHHLVLSCEIGARKPTAAFFQACLGHARGPADKCLFIDDLPDNVGGAKAAGMHGLVYRSGDGLLGQLESLGVKL